MRPDVATVIILGHAKLGGEALQRTPRARMIPRMRISRGRWLLVLCAVAMLAVCAQILFHSQTPDSLSDERPRPVPPRALPRATAHDAGHVASPNRAAQRPGPPDPAMQSTAAAAAENAAKAAADLAAK
jgi:hypothetical protein